MRILLLGKDGQLGRELQRTLLSFGEVVALGRIDADLSNPESLRTMLEQKAPDMIVNAAAYTAVDMAESDAAAAVRVNAEAVAVLADYAKRKDILLVHYSTDYVFDGSKLGAYVETDMPAPQSVYGRSKLAGEEAIRGSSCHALVFRTSWVHSSHGGNFIKTILRLAKERESLNVVDDQFGAPTSAELIADVTALAIMAYRLGKLPCGLYHLVSSGATTWHGLACRIVERAQGNGVAIKLQSNRIKPISSEEYPTPAKRPKNSRLDSNALASALKIDLPDWTIHVDRTIDQLTLKGNLNEA